MAITKIKFERFTAFEKLELKFSPGINVLIGANGTGKTHIMKAAYTACDISKGLVGFAEKLIRVFLPYKYHIGRLVKRRKKSTRGSVEVFQGDMKIRCSFSNHSSVPKSAIVTGERKWKDQSIESVYIPVKEMLANAPGFRSLYSSRDLHFEEIYSDILDRAYKPLLRGPSDPNRKRLLSVLQKTIEGRVVNTIDEEFFLRSKQGNIEFTLLAEGICKLGILWLLIQNGTLQSDSVLFWDEPETNLNPTLYGPLIEILLELQRMGVQLFLATHDYVILKELDLRKTKQDIVLYHALYRDKESDQILTSTTDEYLQIHPNAIQDTFLNLFDRDVKRDFKLSSQ